MAKAESVYAVAHEKCDDLAGNAKDVCVKEAKANRTTSTADAKAQMKTVQAVSSANTDIAKTRETENKAISNARKDASSDKRDAGYSLAIEKCDVLAGTAKDQCVKDAKVSFGKS
jgi:F0F1-type ATP synthase membrane subunit b/b'